jgi:MYXO-CTERM domain-containing protein
MWLSMLVVGISAAAPGPRDAELARLDAPLRALGLGPVASHDAVVVVVESAPDVDLRVVRDRVERGLPTALVEVEARGLLQIRLPERDLRALAAVDGVDRVRPPRRPHPKAFTEGYAAMFEEDWQAYGLTGRGVRVAVLDVGFIGYEDLIGSDLPDVGTDFYRTDWSTEHGTGVAEIIHDIAPGAELTLYDFETDAEFFGQLDAIEAEGFDLVNASIGFDNVWHADDTSPYSEAVNALVAQGITWVAAAGNEDDSYWVGEVTDEDGDGVMEFDGDESLDLFPDDEGDVGLSLRWDEPFGSAGRDLDLEVVGCGTSDAEQNGDDEPYEDVFCAAGGDPDVRIIDNAQTGQPIKVWLYLYAGEWPDGVPTRFSTLTLPADASGAISVAAYSLDFDDLTSYSSTGPTDDGRTKPDITAPTDVSTEAYGEGAFNGTSAATPHVTGALALAIEGGVPSTPAALRSWLRDHAVDQGDPGDDNWWGAGLLVVDDVPDQIPDDVDTGGGNLACSCASTGGAPWAFGLGLGVWVVAGRRRRDLSSLR